MTHDHCPRCKTALESLELATGQVVLSCPGCEGAWVTPEQLQSLAAFLAPGKSLELEGEEPEESRVESYREAAHQGPVCLDCGRPLLLVQFDAVTIDWCPDHGTWFDAGELRQLMKALYAS